MTSKPLSKRFIEWLKFFVSLFTLLCLFGLPAIGLGFGFWLTFCPPNYCSITFEPRTLSIWLRILFPLAGVVTLVLIVLRMWLTDKEEKQLTSMFAEARFIIHYAQTAWGIGAAVSCFLVGLFFFFPVHGDYFERYTGIFGIYFAMLATTLGVHAFYKKDAPILNVFEFLDFVERDLEKVEVDIKNEQKPQFWIVFPALNIGYYRAKSLGYEKKTDEFRIKVSAIAKKLKTDAKALTYHPKYYRPLYDAYERMAQGGQKVELRIDDCFDNAVRFANEFTDRAHIPPYQCNGGEIYFFEHDELPSPVIVVGNVVYSIITYSMPFYDDELGGFDFHPAEKSDLAEIIVYRRDDKVLANTIVNRLVQSLHNRDGSLKSPGVILEHVLNETLPISQPEITLGTPDLTTEATIESTSGDHGLDSNGDSTKTEDRLNPVNLDEITEKKVVENEE